MLEGILSWIIIFAKFDKASSRLSQTCPGVLANAMQCLQFAKCGSTSCRVLVSAPSQPGLGGCH